MRTPLVYDKIADREKVEDQLEKYIQRGYLRRVGLDEEVWLSPLLPIKKPDGSLRFVNDYREANAHFSKKGIEQIDVERTLRRIDPSWKFFMKIDLKDAFFSVPIDEELQRKFTFQWDTKRFAWTRLPQGWC